MVVVVMAVVVVVVVVMVARFTKTESQTVNAFRRFVAETFFMVVVEIHQQRGSYGLAAASLLNTVRGAVVHTAADENERNR